ncbi:MAG TPA: helix-hairpin-helix domain-containing protein [Anaerolineales bacterium]|nr:helix-hairpin-helix domain-containing protein [Anaerolineales bacterium]
MLSPSYLQTDQTSTAWIWYLLLAVFVLLLIFWWVNRRQDVPLDESRNAAVQAQSESAPDDLKRIEGIGPKVSKVLNEAGITTFAGLAAANTTDVQKTLNDAGLQMMNPEGWIEQARLAANGDWEGLERLQNKLKGGRKA